MSNVIEYPAGRVHKRYAAMIPRELCQKGEGVSGAIAQPTADPSPIHPGVVFLGLITLWAFWCAGVR